MSRDDIIDKINSSGADFLIASLGAQKGQFWLRHNHHRLQIPVRAHLGAALNFQAGTLKRAPQIMRKLGLEWLWRIKEEPLLWKRYWNDGKMLIRLFFTRALPLIFWMLWLRVHSGRRAEKLVVTSTYEHELVTLRLSGFATARHVNSAISAFGEAVATKKGITLDFSETRLIDARFLGLLQMLNKKLGTHGATAVCQGLGPGLKAIFRLNGLDFKT